MTLAMIQDTWSPLGFIPALGGAQNTSPMIAPMYLPLDDARRLMAYKILHAYMKNTRRNFLRDADQADITLESGRWVQKTPESSEYREYGEPSLLVVTARALILGDDQSIETKGSTKGIREWIADWAKRENFTQKLLQGETNTIGMGDGVYVLGVSARAKRPKLRVEDPGFYFPDLNAQVDGWDDDDFPPIVHLFWEYEDDKGVIWCRRNTWTMVKLAAAEATPWKTTREWTCYYQAEEIKRSDFAANRTVYSPIMGSNVKVITPPQDLKIDFIPVVHVPNTADVWGESVISLVAQLVDDIEGLDSDLAVSASTANPLLVTEGATATGMTGMPGETLGLPAGAKAAYIAASLKGLLEYSGTLQERLAQNVRLGQVLLGQVAPNDVPSGYALALGFHPARQLMRDSRTVRDEKFPLIVKFALRLAQAHGMADAGDTPNIEVALGASLPSDLQTAVDMVEKLMKVHAMSTETAVRVLQDAGVPNGKIDEEITRITKERYEDAVRLVDATGNAAAAAAMLGIDPVVVPPATIPPTTP